MTVRFVTYTRVSTDKQGRSGLGLEAQEAAIKAHLTATGGTLVGSYTEVESGKRADRPELMKAMAHAKLTGSTLLIAKLDNLSRDAHFLLVLQTSAVPFVACDCPSSDDLRPFPNLKKGGSGSTEVEVMRPAVGAASVCCGWSGV